MVGRLLLINALLLWVYMTAWFLVARWRKRLDTVDTAWGSGFMLVAWAVAFQAGFSLPTTLVALLVTMWSARLTWHIASRSAKRSEDPRYKELSRKWRGNFWLRAYGSIFLAQGALVWMVSLPVVMAAGRPLDGLGWLLPVAAVVWLAGFVCETLADRQLAAFVARADNKGKVLDTGLWRYSRHPNYFGELVQWWAIGLIALQAAFGWIGLAGPLLLTILIVFISGVPPIEKRRRDNRAYQEYARRTSVLVPWPPKAKAV